MCPVANDCLSYALDFEDGEKYRYGMWGGATPQHRAKIAQVQGRVRMYTCPQCDQWKPRPRWGNIATLCSDACRRAAQGQRQRRYEAKRGVRAE